MQAYLPCAGRRAPLGQCTFIRALSSIPKAANQGPRTAQGDQSSPAQTAPNFTPRITSDFGGIVIPSRDEIHSSRKAATPGSVDFQPDLSYLESQTGFSAKLAASRLHWRTGGRSSTSDTPTTLTVSHRPPQSFARQPSPQQSLPQQSPAQQSVERTRSSSQSERPQASALQTGNSPYERPPPRDPSFYKYSRGAPVAQGAGELRAPPFGQLLRGPRHQEDGGGDTPGRPRSNQSRLVGNTMPARARAFKRHDKPGKKKNEQRDEPEDKGEVETLDGEWSTEEGEILLPERRLDYPVVEFGKLFSPPPPVQQLTVGASAVIALAKSTSLTQTSGSLRTQWLLETAGGDYSRWVTHTSLPDTKAIAPVKNAQKVLATRRDVLPAGKNVAEEIIRASLRGQKSVGSRAY